MLIDQARTKMYVGGMHVLVEFSNENFLFDWIEMVERSGRQVYSMLYHMNDVEHDVKMSLADCQLHPTPNFD